MLPGFSDVGGMSGAAFEVSFCGSISYVSGTTISGSIDIGAADPNREIFLVSAIADDIARTLTAATTTVNGEAVTKATNEYQEVFDAITATLTCAFVAVPDGTGSVTITATYSSGPNNGGIVGVYRVVNRPGKGNNQSDSDSGSAAGTTVTVDATTIPANGLWFGAAIRDGIGGTFTPPTGTVEDVEANNNDIRITINSRAIQVNSSTPADVWTLSTSDNKAAASWAFA